MCKFTKRICPRCNMQLPNSSKTACFPKRLHKLPASERCTYAKINRIQAELIECWTCEDDDEISGPVAEAKKNKKEEEPSRREMVGLPPKTSPVKRAKMIVDSLRLHNQRLGNAGTMDDGL